MWEEIQITATEKTAKGLFWFGRGEKKRPSVTVTRTGGKITCIFGDFSLFEASAPYFFLRRRRFITELKGSRRPRRRAEWSTCRHFGGNIYFFNLQPPFLSRSARLVASANEFGVDEPKLTASRGAVGDFKRSGGQNRYFGKATMDSRREIC